MEMLSYVGCLMKIKENEEIKIKENTLSLISSILLRKSRLRQKNYFLIKKRLYFLKVFFMILILLVEFLLCLFILPFVSFSVIKGIDRESAHQSQCIWSNPVV